MARNQRIEKIGLDILLGLIAIVGASMDSLRSKVFVYIRVSSESQAISGLGLKAQENATKTYCKMKGLEIVEIFCDKGVSASTPLNKRPAGAKLIERINNKEAGAVVTNKLDRMFRSTVEALQTIEKWDKIGFRGCFVDIGGMSLDTSTPTGKLMFTIMSGVAELERALISERTSAALKAKKHRGEALGKIPFGYEATVINGKKILVKNEKEQETIRLIKKMRKEISVPKIRKKLNNMGKYNRGKAWHLTSLYRILKRVA